MTPGKRQPGQSFLNGRMRERIQQGHSIDDPWRREAPERESGMPCDGLFDGVQQPSQSGRPFQLRVNEVKQVEVRQPGKGLAGFTFRQHVEEFTRKARRGEAAHQSHFRRFRQEHSRVPVKVKPQALLKPDGAEYASRVVDKAEPVQHANGFVF